MGEVIADEDAEVCMDEFDVVVVVAVVFVVSKRFVSRRS
jgi:hypothetical protein